MEDLFFIFAVLALSGAVAGFLSGLMGIGGGIVMVPVLYYAFGFIGAPEVYLMHLAVGTSLGIIIPTAFVSSKAHQKRGAVDFEIAKTWIPWMVVGAVFGTMVASDVNSEALVLFFAVMASLMGLKLVLPLDNQVISRKMPKRGVSSALGLAIGTASSMMGIGGATFTVPTMVLFNIPIHRAVGTAAFMGFFLAIFATIGFVVAGWNVEGLPEYSFGFVSLIGVLVVAPASSSMAPLGVAVSHKLPRRKLSIVFGLFLIAASVRMAYPLLGI
ncbi:MAG: sulfite exporter TauE/SafE family protein [Alphaproteobacteria bacterium]